MIDIKLIRNSPDEVKKLLKTRGCDVDVDIFLSVDTSFNQKRIRLDEIRHELNNLGGQNKDAAKSLKEEAGFLKEDIKRLEEERDTMWGLLPNLLAEDTPPGKDDKDSPELRKVGNFKKFDFEPKPHEVLGEKLDILDLERGAKVAAAGFYYLKGDGARLAWAVFHLGLNLMAERGFEVMMTPVMAKKKTFFGTGYLPFGADQLYKIENNDLYVIGTSEQTLVGIHEEEILPVETLPRLYTAFTPCFRTEAGSYGRSSKGAFRVHQFHKVEQIVFCRPEDSEKWHLECLKNIEDLMALLEIPYRVVRVCLGDLGAPAYKKYDVEGWFPGFGEFRETHSNTNILDFQTRRLGIRCKEDGKTFHPHTISSTLITDRAVLGIFENNQQADGTIIIPKALRPYMGGQEVIKPKT